ncbi:MAG: LuxR C-terminal-related transcriptional regulator [Terriglobales bacterium]
MLGERSGTERIRNRRERVIELVARGLTNRDVAEELGTTEYVVKNYLRTIYDQLGLWNRVELALWYEARRHETRASGEDARTERLRGRGTIPAPELN